MRHVARQQRDRRAGAVPDLTVPERLAQRETDEQTRRGLETILSESERAAKIVRNLLTFARKRHTTRAMVDMNQVVRETLALRSYEQRVSNITILEALPSGLPQVFADPHQIQQILLNLIVNAEQAMLDAHGRGTLILRSWHDPDRDAVILEVNDDGPGVPDYALARVFERFYSLPRPDGQDRSTGLGLCFVREVAMLHRGQIALANRDEGGACATLTLPSPG